MTSVTIVLCVALFALAMMQTVYVFRFANFFSGPNEPGLLQDPHCPEAHVVMCVRGKDPHLSDCLAAISAQNYPRYKIHIVVDNEDDPSMPLIQEKCHSKDHIEIHLLKDPLDSCSLKCSSLVQVIRQLPADAIVALLDSDTIPDQSWLRSLASGLRASDVGAVSGIRWYEPNEKNLGTIIRYVWNAAAIVQMVIYRIAWGGSVGIAQGVVENTQIIDKWSQAFCEDTMLTDKLAKHELTTAFRSDLFIVNRESCQISDFHHWLTRQLLAAKLYHPSWPLVAAHAIGTTLAIVLAGLLTGYAFVIGQRNCGIALAIASVLFQVINLGLLIKIERTVRSCLPVSETRRVSVFHLFVAGVLAQLLYFASVIRAMFLTSVDWRGIQYRIHGPYRVQMTGYRPFRQDESNSTDSL